MMILEVNEDVQCAANITTKASLNQTSNVCLAYGVARQRRSRADLKK
jgi:hypothetical protein